MAFAIPLPFELQTEGLHLRALEDEDWRLEYDLSRVPDVPRWGRRAWRAWTTQNLKCFTCCCHEDGISARRTSAGKSTGRGGCAEPLDL